MKNILYILLFILPFSCLAQGSWVLQNSATTTNLYGIFFTDNYHGWACGESGKMIHTSNGGNTWTSQVSNVTQTINSVFFADTSNGWAACNTGIIIHTTDGGATWSTQTSGTTQNLLRIQFTDVNTGWAVGASGAIRHTETGGASWTTQTSSAVPSSNGLYFLDNQKGWAVANTGKIIKTTDGGQNWNTMTSGTSYNLMSVHFADSLNGWTVGISATILHTSDGGQTWSAQNSTVANTISLLSVFFTDSLKGWASGTGGTLLYTADGGNTWQNMTSTAITVTLRSIYFVNPYNGWLAGHAGKIYNNKSHEEICLVTVDDVAAKNKVIWEKLAGMGTSFYKVFVLSGGSYIVMDTVPYDNMSEYIDVTSQPEVMAARYKISAVDSFGFESAQSPYHQTISLGVSQGVPSSTMVLDWTFYEDESGNFAPDWYYILRGDAPTNLALYDSVSGAFQTYNNVNVFDVYYYKIAISKPSPCVPSSTFKTNGGPYSQSVSNVEDNGMFIGIENRDAAESFVKIYPNPFSDQTTISVGNMQSAVGNGQPARIGDNRGGSAVGNGQSAMGKWNLTITDVMGKVVRIYDSIAIQNHEIVISRGDLKAGVYFLEMRGEKVYRGKLIVE